MSRWTIFLSAVIAVNAASPAVTHAAEAPASAVAAQAADPCSFLQDEEDQTRFKNCQIIFEKKLIPNVKAISYTLAYLRDNTGRLADNKCLPPVVGEYTATIRIKKKKKWIAKTVTETKPGEEGWSKEKLSNTGIKNKCVFLLNDVFSGKDFKSNGYFVDLCATDPNKIVKRLDLRRGTGSGADRAKGRHRDREGDKSTVFGAFLTGSATFAFQPFKMNDGYRRIKKNNNGKITGLRLFGVNSSNNNTSQGKPLHMTPLVSSWGCPSMDLENGFVMDRLAESGPALVMNYGPDAYHQSTIVCENGDGSKPPGPAPVELPETAPVPEKRPDLEGGQQ